MAIAIMMMMMMVMMMIYGIDDDDDDNDGSVDPRMSGTHDAVVLGRTLPTSTNIGLSLGTPIMVMLMSREKQHKEEH